jgi:hypothetical protein
MDAVLGCEQLPGSFCLRVLRVELAPHCQSVALRVGGAQGGPGEGPAGAPDAPAPCALKVRLTSPRAWGDAAAAHLRRRLPAFRRLQVLWVRGLAARQEAELVQVGGCWLEKGFGLVGLGISPHLLG